MQTGLQYVPNKNKSYGRTVLMIVAILLFLFLRHDQVFKRLIVSHRVIQVGKEVVNSSLNSPLFAFTVLDWDSPSSSACEKAIIFIDKTYSDIDSYDSFDAIRFLSIACEKDIVTITRYEQSIGLSYQPNALDGLFIGELLRRNGPSASAYDLLSSFPKSSYFYAHLGRIEIEKNNDLPQALKYFETAEMIDSRYDIRKSSMYLYLCLELIKKSSIHVINEPCHALNNVDSSPRALTLLGRYYYSHDEYRKALGYFTQSLAMDNMAVETYYWIGQAYRQLGNPESAINYWELGLLQDDAFLPIYYELAVLAQEKQCNSKSFNIISAIREVAGHQEEAEDYINNLLQQQIDTPDSSIGCMLFNNW